MDNETWMSIIGTNGFYKVSNLGNILTFKTGRWKPKKCCDSKGYKLVGLNINNKTITFKVHRLVAMAFIPNPDNKPFINHINCIKHDNRVENLEWCTQKENIHHAIANGKFKGRTSIRSTDRIVLQFTINNIFISEYPQIMKSSKLTGINHSSIILVCQGKRETAGGYKWKYK